MPIDRIKNMSDAALLARLQRLVARQPMDDAALRRVVEDVRSRNLSLPPWMEAVLEDRQDDVPLDGVVALPDETFRVDVCLTRKTYGHLLEVATLMDETSVEHDAGAIIAWALRRMLELHRDTMPPPPGPRR
jgi:hypothetical protein